MEAGGATRWRAAAVSALVAVPLVAAVGCGESTGPRSGGSGEPLTPPADASQLECSIPRDEIRDGGVGRGGIPALTDPTIVGADDPRADYMLPEDRVIGLVIDGTALAVPHNILWWHEIVNFNLLGRRIAVTYCPLTGSSLIFNMARAGVNKFIVSGLLFLNNLMMVDEDTDSLWPQMSRGARCGPADGVDLEVLPSIEMTWKAWKELHPETGILSGETGFSRDYTLYPYGDYERLDAPPAFRVPITDLRRSTKERVLGIPRQDGSVLTFPFLELAEQGPTAVAQATVDAVPVAVFYDEDAFTAIAFSREVGGETLDFRVEDGGIVDDQTGSTWRFDGLATEGPLAGTELEPVSDAFVAFWFAWANFHPGPDIWTNQGS